MYCMLTMKAVLYIIISLEYLVVHCHTCVSEVLTISFIHVIYREYEEIQLHAQHPQTLPTQKCEAYGFLVYYIHEYPYSYCSIMQAVYFGILSYLNSMHVAIGCS